MFRRLKFEISSHPDQNEKSYETSIFYPLEAADGLYWPRRSVSCTGLNRGCLEVSKMVRHLVFRWKLEPTETSQKSLESWTQTTWKLWPPGMGPLSVLGDKSLKGIQITDKNWWRPCNNWHFASKSNLWQWELPARAGGVWGMWRWNANIQNRSNLNLWQRGNHPCQIQAMDVHWQWSETGYYCRSNRVHRKSWKLSCWL